MDTIMKNGHAGIHLIVEYCSLQIEDVLLKIARKLDGIN